MKQIKQFLNECVVVDINRKIKEAAVYFRVQYGLKLPDAIVAATSFYLGVPLVTADKIFTKVQEITIFKLT